MEKLFCVVAIGFCIYNVLFFGLAHAMEFFWYQKNDTLSRVSVNVGLDRYSNRKPERKRSHDALDKAISKGYLTRYKRVDILSKH